METRWGGNGISLWLRLQRSRKFPETLRDQVWSQGPSRSNKRPGGTFESCPLAVLAGGLARGGLFPMSRWVLPQSSESFEVSLMASAFTLSSLRTPGGDT